MDFPFESSEEECLPRGLGVDEVRFMGNFFTRPLVFGVNNPLVSKQSYSEHSKDRKLLFYEDLLRLASKLTLPEMVAYFNGAETASPVSNGRISHRLEEALDEIAEARDLPREVVKREFKCAKNESGVNKRQYAIATAKRQRTIAAQRGFECNTEFQEGHLTPQNDGQPSSPEVEAARILLMLHAEAMMILEGNA